VQLLGVCETPEAVYLVYDYMAGGDLETRLACRPPLSWSQRLAIAYGIARGIAYLHLAAARVHRDSNKKTKKMKKKRKKIKIKESKRKKEI
jgi:serine/threonine protein kinase